MGLAARGASSPARAATRHAAAPFSRVLALADPSANGAIVVAHAGLLAQAAGAVLTVFHAADPGGLPGAAGEKGHVNAMRSAAMRLSRATLEAQVQATGVLRRQRHVLVEAAAPTPETMAQAARRTSADMVVMAPRHRGTLAHVLGASITASTIDLLREHVPVLCARGEATPYRRIVVATDFSAGSRRAFRMAARLAALFGGEVSVVHVPPSRDDDVAVNAALQRFLPAELSCRGPELLVEHGEPWTAILEVAARKGANLVILSAGGRGRLRDAVLGSQAERVVRHAPCPVLVI